MGLRGVLEGPRFHCKWRTLSDFLRRGFRGVCVWFLGSLGFYRTIGFEKGFGKYSPPQRLQATVLLAHRQQQARRRPFRQQGAGDRPPGGAASKTAGDHSRRTATKAPGDLSGRRPLPRLCSYNDGKTPAAHAILPTVQPHRRKDDVLTAVAAVPPQRL